MFGRKKENHTLARRAVAEIGDEMSQVVLFVLSDRAVGQKDVRLTTGQPPNRVIRVEPRIDPGRGIELGSWRSELDGAPPVSEATRVSNGRRLPVALATSRGGGGGSHRLGTEVPHDELEHSDVPMVLEIGPPESVP